LGDASSELLGCDGITVFDAFGKGFLMLLDATNG
jgi:hypothetical protein